MDMDELINMVAKKETISVYPIYGGWFDIGQWEEYSKVLEKMQSLK
jgi:NDP-sugar pyrophosphorylase family protein